MDTPDGGAESHPQHRQDGYDVRVEWGPTGARAITGGSAPATIAVVIDVLSFTSTVQVAVERGIGVLPYRWKGADAELYAAEHDAALAIGRFDQRRDDRGLDDRGLTLSPAQIANLTEAQVAETPRLVLPSPNGSSICFSLVERGLRVVAASLRNRGAVADWLAERAGPASPIAIVAAGERWPDGTLRPCLEDLWGAGAVVAALAERAPQLTFSPEARASAAAFAVVEHDIEAELLDCSSGRELIEAGFVDDVLTASRIDRGSAVPVLEPAREERIFVRAD